MLCSVIQCYVVLCSGMQWTAVLCNVMQCYAVSSLTMQWNMQWYAVSSEEPRRYWWSSTRPKSSSCQQPQPPPQHSFPAHAFLQCYALEYAVLCSEHPHPPQHSFPAHTVSDQNLSKLSFAFRNQISTHTFWPEGEGWKFLKAIFEGWFREAVHIKKSQGYGHFP